TFAESLAGGVFFALGLALRIAGGRDQHVENTVFRGVFSLGAYASDLDVARLLDRDFVQLADDGVDVAPHVADRGEFGGLDLDERGIGQLGQAAGNFCLAHAGGPDHQDVLGDDFVAQGLGHLLAAPTVAQRNGHGAFGAVLPDNVL